MADVAVTPLGTGPGLRALDGWEVLVHRLGRHQPIDADVSALVDEAVAIWSRPGFEQFASSVAPETGAALSRAADTTSHSPGARTPTDSAPPEAP